MVDTGVIRAMVSSVSVRIVAGHRTRDLGSEPLVSGDHQGVNACRAYLVRPLFGFIRQRGLNASAPL